MNRTRTDTLVLYILFAHLNKTFAILCAHERPSSPYVHTTDLLRDVLRRMREMNVSGAVREDEEQYSLLYVREVIFGLHRNPESTVAAIRQLLVLDKSSDVHLVRRIHIIVKGPIVKRPILDEVGGYGVLRDPEGISNRGEGHVFEAHVFVRANPFRIFRESIDVEPAGLLL